MIPVYTSRTSHLKLSFYILIKHFSFHYRNPANEATSKSRCCPIGGFHCFFGFRETMFDRRPTLICKCIVFLATLCVYIYIQYRLYLVKKDVMFQGSFDIHQTDRFFLMHKCVSQEPPAAAQQRSQLIRLTHNQSMSQLCQRPQRHPRRVSCRHWPQQMTRDLSIR